MPGNHDWFNALDGFAANLMDPATARAAIDARVESDLSLSSTTDDRIERLLAEAARLRAVYRVPAGRQHGPFFELHSGGFSLIAIDTGIRRAVDERQLAWLNAALGRAEWELHHGHSRPSVLRRRPRSRSATTRSREVHELLRSRGVRVMMAGDTHDFEHYLDAQQHGRRRTTSSTVAEART